MLPEETAAAAAAVLGHCKQHGPFAAACQLGALPTAQLLATQLQDPAALQHFLLLASQGSLAAVADPGGSSRAQQPALPSELQKLVMAAGLGPTAPHSWSNLQMLAGAAGLAQQGNALGASQLLQQAWQLASAPAAPPQLQLASWAASNALDVMCSSSAAAGSTMGKQDAARALQAAQQLLALPGLCPSLPTCARLLQLSAQAGDTEVPQLVLSALLQAELPQPQFSEPVAQLLGRYLDQAVQAAVAEQAAQAAMAPPAPAAGTGAAGAAAAEPADGASALLQAMPQLFSRVVTPLAQQLGLASTQQHLRAALSSFAAAGYAALLPSLLDALQTPAGSSGGTVAAAADPRELAAAEVFGQLAAECAVAADADGMLLLLRHVEARFAPSTAGETVARHCLPPAPVATRQHS